jgi:hypothetical protein
MHVVLCNFHKTYSYLYTRRHFQISCRYINFTSAQSKRVDQATKSTRSTHLNFYTYIFTIQVHDIINPLTTPCVAVTDSRSELTFLPLLSQTSCPYRKHPYLHLLAPPTPKAAHDMGAPPVHYFMHQGDWTLSTTTNFSNYQLTSSKFTTKLPWLTPAITLLFAPNGN